MSDEDPGLRERISKQGEEALGRLAEELVSNPLVSGALTRAFEAREKAVQAQEVAMGALGLPSAADIERLTRRLRSVSQRLEGIEDAVDRLDERLDSLDGRLGALDERLAGIQGGVGNLAGQLDRKASSARGRASARGKETGDLSGRLEEIGRDVAALRKALSAEEEPPPRAQERLAVSEG